MDPKNISKETIDDAVSKIAEQMTPEQINQAKGASDGAHDYIKKNSKNVESVIERVKKEIQSGKNVDTDSIVDQLDDIDDDAKASVKQLFRNMGPNFIQNFTGVKKDAGPRKVYLHITGSGKSKFVTTESDIMQVIQGKLPRGFTIGEYKTPSGRVLHVFNDAVSGRKNGTAKKITNIDLNGDVIIVNPSGGDMTKELLL